MGFALLQILVAAGLFSVGHNADQVRWAAAGADAPLIAGCCRCPPVLPCNRSLRASCGQLTACAERLTSKTETQPMPLHPLCR